MKLNIRYVQDQIILIIDFYMSLKSGFCKITKNFRLSGCYKRDKNAESLNGII